MSKIVKDCGCVEWTSTGKLLRCKCKKNTLTPDEYEKMLDKRLMPAHEVVIELLESEPTTYFIPFAKMYLKGIFVPKEDLPRLAEAFRKAREEAVDSLSIQASKKFQKAVSGVETFLLNQVNK